MSSYMVTKSPKYGKRNGDGRGKHGGSFNCPACHSEFELTKEELKPNKKVTHHICGKTFLISEVHGFDANTLRIELQYANA